MSVPAKDYGGEQAWRIGRRLKHRRNGLGLLQEDVAQKLRALGMDATDGTVSNMEKGIGLGAAKLPILAVALRCTVTYLLDLTEEPTKWTPDQPLERVVKTRVSPHGRHSRSLVAVPSGAVVDTRGVIHAPLPGLSV